MMTIDGWVMRNGCTTGPTEVYRNGTAHCDLHSGCTAGADVELCSIDGGLHDWFGGGLALDRRRDAFGLRRDQRVCRLLRCASDALSGVLDGDLQRACGARLLAVDD